MNVLKINNWRNVTEKNYTGIVKYPNGTRFWFLNGKHHREDGPAIEWNDGDKHWYLYDKLHRTDGPAIESFDGKKHWFINGVEYSQEEWFEQLSEEDKLNAIWNLK
jgi:hypothetical protein